MKKLLLSLLILAGFYLNSQTTCQTAQPFCAGGVSGVTFPATTSVTTAQVGPNYGCLGSTPNPAWYYLQINGSGNLDILIQGTITAPPGPGQDVDFICWGPFNSLTNICDSLTLNKIVDCSYSGSFTETLNIPSGVTGQYYMVLITNFANITQDIIFSQYAGTGSTNCGLVASNYKICAGTSATLVANNSGSLSNASFSMNPGGIVNSTGSFVVSPLATNNYSLFVTGVNSLNQVITQTAVSTVTVNPQPNAAPTVTNSTCTSSVNAFNLHVTFTPSTSVPGYTINWSTVPNGILSPSQTTLTGGINAGAYIATITAAGGCSVVTAFTIDPQPEPATIILDPPGKSHVLTCLMPVLTVSCLIAANNYTWSNGLNAPVIGPVAVFSSTTLGTWTINSVNPNSGCVSSEILVITQNMSAPSSTVTPLSQNITCSVTSIITVTATANPSVNVTHHILSPLGGTFSSTSYTTVYQPGAPGTYSHCAVNDVNGCSTCKTFSVFSNQGFPTFNVVSPQNFTLGCTTTSIASINIINASATNSNQVPTGGPVSYTLLSPSSSSATSPGTLSTQSSYTVNAPGTWTIVTKDNTSLCETRLSISVLQNTFQPNISALVERQILDCYVPKITLKGQSTTPNISYVWGFPGVPGTQPGDTIVVGIKPAAPLNTLVANYTLTITDNINTCKSTSVIPIYQNTFPPKAFISNGGTSSLTCNTGTVTLTNQSSTGIPPATGFPAFSPVIAYLWFGPTPQQPGQVSSTYVAGIVGTYTMIAKDLNNGCLSTATTEISDNRIYPLLNRPIAPAPFILDCGANSTKVSAIINNVTAGFTYTWTAVSGATVAGANTATLTTNLPGLYKVLARNVINGCASSGEVTVINGTLNADFKSDFEQGFAPLAVNFTNTSASSNDNSGITSTWSFGNGTYSVLPSATVSPNTMYTSPGTYSVTMFVSKGTCIDTVQKAISVEIPSQLLIPNVFTPNGDKVNDLFFLKAANLDVIVFIIYDRWGQKVFDMTSTTGNIVWDGKNQAGTEVSEGVYFYSMTASGKDGSEYRKNGTISLLR